MSSEKPIAVPVDSIEKIRNAFGRVWKVATNQHLGGKIPLMSIPPDRDLDADFIMDRALAELGRLRSEVAYLRNGMAITREAAFKAGFDVNYNDVEYRRRLESHWNKFLDCIEKSKL